MLTITTVRICLIALIFTVIGWSLFVRSGAAGAPDGRDLGGSVQQHMTSSLLPPKNAVGKLFSGMNSDHQLNGPSSVIAMLLPRMQADASMKAVATAILVWDGSNPGDLFKAVKAANPEKAAIVSMRELNKAMTDGKMPADVMRNSSAIIQKQKAAQKLVRQKVLSARNSSYSNYLSNNPKARSIYGNGDIGSWPTAADPDASMDIDWTVFGVDPDATAELRDQCKADLLRELVGEESGLTLADFDVVITAEGHEAAAGVFETEGGIDWAKRNMKRVTIVQPDGTARTFELGTGDPIKEMAQAEHMAKFRDLATKNGDYEKLFDNKGFLKSAIFDDPNNTAAQELWNKYMEMLSDFGIDYYRSRSSTATGGCLDMAKHLQEEVINRKHEPKAKLKKTLKYVSRADNISRGVPGLEKMLAADPLLSDPAYKDVVELARQISRVSDAQVDAIIKERFGDMPDAGLQELGAKARRAILRMSEVAFQAEMDRIILEVPDKAERKAALDKLTEDFRIVSEEGGEYSDLARSAVEQISKVQEANESGTIDAIKKNYNSLEKIRQADQSLIARTVEYLNQTKLGNKMLEKGGKLLELGKKPVFDPVEAKYRSGTVEFVGSVSEEVRAQNLKVVDYLASAAMWTSVIDDVRNSKSDAELAIALSKTLVNNTFFGMVLNSAYAGVVMGDNDALGKAIMYLLVPETALPALVEALGHTAINIGAQTLFDAQMDKVYLATTFDKDGQITDFSGLGMKGDEGAKYFVDTMCDRVPEEVAQDIIAKSKATDFGNFANVVAIRGAAKSIRSTVDNGNPLIFKEDGPVMNAAAAIRKTTEDINDLAKILGVEVALSANNANDLPGGLDKGQTGAFLSLFKQREKFRGEARQALTEAIVRTFAERNRAEVALNSGKAKDEYDALLKIFEELGISKEGYSSLDQEGSPFNIITRNWGTSTREKQVAAVKAVQKFKDAYGFVLQSRNSAEGVAQNNLGESYQPAPRPLTGSLPLTAKPEMDTQNARAYLAEIAPIGEKTAGDLKLIKKSELEGNYDSEMFKKLYEVRFNIAYWSHMMKAAQDAQSLHWAIEIFDKQALYDKHSEAANKISDLRKTESVIEDEFRKHYEVTGETIVDLTGPEFVPPGQEAFFTCTVTTRDKDGAVHELSEDIARQLKYRWSSGKANLGEDQRAQRSYKLETEGDQEFTVIVTRQTIAAGKTVSTELGRKTVKVRVGGDISARIDGKLLANIDEEIPLKAVVETRKPPLPDLKYEWAIDTATLGDKDTAVFKQKQAGIYKVKLRILTKAGAGWVAIAGDTKEISVGRSPVKVVIEGPNKAKPDEKIQLKAVVTVDRKAFPEYRMVWKEGQTALGAGESLPYSSREQKAHRITVLVMVKPAGETLEKEIASTEYEIVVSAEETTLVGVTADVSGLKSSVVKGGSVELAAANFRDAKGALSADKNVFKVVWSSEPYGLFTPASTVNGEKTSIVASRPAGETISVWGDILMQSGDKFVPVGKTEKVKFTVTDSTLTVGLKATKTTLTQGDTADVIASVDSLGVDRPLKFVWTGDHAASSADNSKVTFASRKSGQHVLSVEVTDASGRKGTASVTLTVLGVTASLEALPGQILYATKAPVKVRIDGLDQLMAAIKPTGTSGTPPQEWVLTSIERQDNKPIDSGEGLPKQTSKHADSSFEAKETSATKPEFYVEVKASWGMPPARVKPGTEVRIPWELTCTGPWCANYGWGELAIFSSQDSGNYDNRKPEDQHSTRKGQAQSQKGVYTRKFPEGIPGSHFSIYVDAEGTSMSNVTEDIANQGRTFVYTFAAENAATLTRPVKIIWQSEPGVSFLPPTSSDYQTTAQFDRMGKIKVWAEVQIDLEGDGRFQSVGETAQQEIEVTAPKFKITYTPTEGQGKVGQEIKAIITEDPPRSPALDPALIEFVWTNPASSNRMEYNQNASQIGFKLKDPKPLDLLVTAKVPKWLDTITEVKSSYTASAFTVKADVLGSGGPKPQIFRAGVGLVTVEKNVYCSGEMVRVKAAIEGEGVPSDVRWKWIANEGTTLVNDITQEITVSRHETGSANLEVEARDKDGVLLGKATVSFSVTVSAEQLKEAKTKAAAADTANLSKNAALEKLTKAKEIVRKGQLDEAITLAGEAATTDPANTEAGSLAKEWKQERETCLAQIEKTKQLMAEGKYPEASNALVVAKNLHGLYKPVQDMVSQLDAEWHAWDSKIQSDIGEIRMASERREFKRALDLAAKRRAEGKIGPYERTLSDQEQWARRWEDEKEQKRQILKAAEAKVKQYDYAGALKDFEVGFANSNILWAASDPEPPYYYKLRDEAFARNKRINELMPYIKQTAEDSNARTDLIEAHIRNADEVLALQPNNDDARRYREMLSARLSEGATKSAAARFTKDGEDLFKKGRHEEAIAAFNGAIEADPNSARAYTGRCYARWALEDSAAIVDCEKALQLDPKNVGAYHLRGVIKLTKGDITGDINDQTRAMTLAPNEAALYFERARARTAAKDYDGAIADYNQCIALEPTNKLAVYNRCGVLYDRGSYREALADCERYVASDPNDSDGFSLRGMVKEKLEDTGGAIADYEKALSLNPNNEYARKSLASLNTRLANANDSAVKKESGTIDLSGERWNWFDPNADASYNATGETIAIRAPKGNDLWPATNFDGPRLSKTVSGDFTLQVRVNGEWREGYNGAGLTVYAGRNSVIRLERGIQGSPSADDHVAIFGFVNGSGTGSAHILFKSSDVYLKLERRSNQFTGYASTNGTTWQKVGTVKAELPDRVEAGLLLVNEYNANIFEATFSEFKLLKTVTAAPSISGRWKTVCCNGKYTGVFVLQQSGSRLTGSVEEPSNRTYGELEGTIEGNRVRLTRRWPGGLQTYELLLDASFNRMSGTFDGTRDMTAGTDTQLEREGEVPSPANPNETPVNQPVADYEKQGDEFLEGKQYDDALAAYTKAVELKPTANAYYHIGWIHNDRNEFEQAISALDQSIRTSPNNPLAWFEVGYANRNLKRFDKALNAYRRAIALKPDYAAAYYEIGWIHNDQGQYAQAVEALTQATRLRTDYAEAHLELGYAYYGLNRLPEAVQEYGVAIRLKPDYALAHYNLGIALVDQGKRDGALEQYRILQTIDAERAKRLYERIQTLSETPSTPTKPSETPTEDSFDKTPRWPTNEAGYPDIAGEWIEVSGYPSNGSSVIVTQSGDTVVAVGRYNIGNTRIAHRTDGTITRAGVITGRLVHLEGVSPGSPGFAQDRQLTLTPDGNTLDISAESVGGGGAHKVSWRRARTTPTTPTTKPPSSQVSIFDSMNIYGVGNQPTAPAIFTIRRPHVITSIMTYHWNNGRGTRVGTIALRDAAGRTYGPWSVSGTPGQGGVPNANWACTPNVEIPAGSYTIVDSEPSTWSQNTQSGGRGMAVVKAYPSGSSQSAANVTPTPAPTPSRVNTQVQKNGGGSVVAIFENKSTDNVHILVEGETFSPSNRLAPGETRRVNLRMTADGRIKFIAGRNGQVITTKIWNGDPSDPNRFPRVVFSANGQLAVMTGLR